MFHVNSGEAEAGKHSWERNHSMEGKKERNNKPPKKLYVPQFLSSFQKKWNLLEIGKISECAIVLNHHYFYLV